MIAAPRACTAFERNAMIAMVDSVMRSGTGQSMLTDYPLVYRDDNLPNIQLITVSDQVASVVPFIPHELDLDGCRLTIGIISPTATHPEYRGRGYALRCLNRCLELMKDQQVDLSVLWTEVLTFAFYRHAEYQAIPAQQDAFRLNVGDIDLFADAGEVIETLNLNDGDSVEAIRRLHEAETCGVCRRPADYKALFSLPKMTTLLARRNHQVVAYLVTSRAINKPGLIEAEGDDAALQTLIHNVLSRLAKGEAVTAIVNRSPHALERLLSRVMNDRRVPADTGHQMVRINDARRFLEKITPILGREAAAMLGNARLPRRALTAALFGAHPEMPAEVPARTAGLSPVHFPVWTLDRS